MFLRQKNVYLLKKITISQNLAWDDNEFIANPGVTKEEEELIGVFSSNNNAKLAIETLFKDKEQIVDEGHNVFRTTYYFSEEAKLPRNKLENQKHYNSVGLNSSVIVDGKTYVVDALMPKVNFINSTQQKQPGEE